MSSVPHLKGVRTRYRNILERKIDEGKTMLLTDVESDTVDSVIVSTGMCYDSLKLYSEKLENQSEKLATAVGDSDSEFVEEITEADSALCEDAVQCFMKLKHHREMLLCLKEKHKDTAPSGDHPMMMLQQDMYKLMELQIQHQEKILEGQTKGVKVSSVKLPKLDIISFGGDKTKWIEFWDSFKCSVHDNKNLSDSEKFNYLKSKVYGEAKRAISGLMLSDGNYHLAIDILKERFGDVQEVIDVHYNQLINLQPAKNETSQLRSLLDNVETHLRSLEVLGQDINQDVFVSMVRAKLSEDILIQLEIKKGADKKWSIASLRDSLKEYVMARERSEKQVNASSDKRHIPSSAKAPFGRQDTSYKRDVPKGSGNSTHALSTLTKQRTLTQTRSEDYANKCRYCKQKHWSDECSKYKSISDRKEQLKDSCYRCLKVGHRSCDCKRTKSCVYCGEVNKHHRSLCPQKFQVNGSIAHLVNEIELDTETPEENVLMSSSETVLMQTVSTEIKNPDKKNKQQVRILLDSGSHRTYVTEKLAKKLELTAIGEQEIKLVTFGSNSSQTIKTKYTKLDMMLKNGQFTTITVNIVSTISGALHRRPVKALQTEQVKDILESVDLADTLPTDRELSSIEMLIGNDYYLDFILCQKLEIQPGLFLLGSKFGWILSGRTSDCESHDEPCMLIFSQGSELMNTSMISSFDSVVSSKPNFEDFWQVESIGIVDKLGNTGDDIAMSKFRETVKFENGRYQVTWPWIDESPNLPENRQLALGRLRSCVNKLKGKPSLMEKYDSVIKEQLIKGIIEKAERSKTDGLVHYLPHHAVITPQKTTTKLRVVYDASAKTRKENQSLNECLYRGPVMLQDLCGMLLRFRMSPIAIVAEIEKAFLQIGLQPGQRDVTRFMWLKDFTNPSVDKDNLEEYRFCRVPFWVISSPFLLGATIDHHLSSYNSDVANKIRKNIYVDNLITGVSNVPEGLELYTKSKSMFQEASMNLREWVTNDKAINEFIPSNDRADREAVTVLGHQWDVNEDTIKLKAPKIILDKPDMTKRDVLKTIASVFDPLGLLSPVLLRGKVLLQSLWLKRLDWDDQLENEDREKWSSMVADFNDISKVAIPRCFFMTTSKAVSTSYTLCCFCDASALAYSTVIYIRANQDEVTTVDLAFTKTRLAPVKKMSIPRLELLAVVVGIRCIKFVQNQLRVPIADTYLWSDSKCVLSWINSNKTLSMFVKNRISEIKESSEIKYGYIPTKMNVADLASRGTTLNKLKENKFWWHGPEWLYQPSNDWPTFSFTLDETSERKYADEIKEAKTCVEMTLCENGEQIAKTTSSEKCPFGIDTNRYSSVTKLLRVTALVLRFIRKLRKNKCNSGPLTYPELLESEELWLRHIQEKHFNSEIASIQKGKVTNLQRQLGLFLDSHGLLRCRSRLENAELSESARYPILLPRHDRYTELVILKTHKEVLHSGVSQTLAKTRFKFWIPHGRAKVKYVLNKCGVCRRHEGGAYKMPPFSPLPKSRTVESKPFSRTGLDYLGPIYIKTKEDNTKVWICLFTCLVTRAIHLEVVSDMSTEQFLLCFRRFVAQRGTAVEIISDNAKQFKAASSVIDRVWLRVLHSDEVQSYVSNAGIKWSFIVELSPWMGGFYERLVGLVKRSLRKTIGRNLLTLIQLQTLLKETEAVINSRPLVYVGDDLHSTITLTPSHFLILNPDTGIPECSEESDSDYSPYESSVDRLLNIWKKGQKLLNKFWQIWREDYLLSLRERTQSRLKTHRIQSHSIPKIGDVVLIKEDVSRGHWKLAKIKKLTTSNDGNIRSCSVELPSGIVLNRPLNLLFPIETSNNSVDEDLTEDCNEHSTDD